MNLRIPGPTPVPDEVLQASARQMINHRGPEFGEILQRVTRNLQRVFATQHDVLVLTASGTGGLEAAVVNTLSPGDGVLSVSMGVFGDRFAQIAEAYGARVTRLAAEWGRAADPEEVRRALRSDPGITAVLVTHNETSTGVTSDLAAIAGVVKEHERLLLVDGVSSVSAIPLPADEWRCDVVVSSSQKGWMAPPGLAFISMSEAAWRAYREARMPRFYLDAGKARSYLERGQNPWTPAVSVVYAMDAALEGMLREGMDNVYRRHERVGRTSREGVQRLGLSLFADPSHASNTVTSINLPEGVDGKALLERLRTEHGVVLAVGQQRLLGKIFRIGHMGYVQESDIGQALSALEATLPVVGFQPSRSGAGRS